MRSGCFSQLDYLGASGMSTLPLDRWAPWPVFWDLFTATSSENSPAMANKPGLWSRSYASGYLDPCFFLSESIPICWWRTGGPLIPIWREDHFASSKRMQSQSERFVGSHFTIGQNLPRAQSPGLQSKTAKTNLTESPLMSPLLKHLAILQEPGQDFPL